MRHTLTVAAAYAWALWFGGLMTLFLLITTLFHTFVAEQSHPTADAYTTPASLNTSAGSPSEARTQPSAPRSAPDGRREVFDEIGSVVFGRFERYQLVLAAATLLLSALGAILGGITRPRLVLLTLLILSTGAALVETAAFRPQLERLLAARQTHEPDFARVHGLSMLTYAVQSVLLFLAGLALMADLRQDRPRRA